MGRETGRLPIRYTGDVRGWGLWEETISARKGKAGLALGSVRPAS
jgi:hypothetical protein